MGASAGCGPVFTYLHNPAGFVGDGQSVGVDSPWWFAVGNALFDNAGNFVGVSWNPDFGVGADAHAMDSRTVVY